MNRPSRAIRLLLTIAVSGVVFFGPVPEAQGKVHVVKILEKDPNKAATWVFEPADIDIAVNDTVVWEWHADDKHSATADDGSFDSKEIKGRGKKWEHKFTKAGDVPYSCTPHPFMVGTVKV
jgi:plastocyanin